MAQKSERKLWWVEHPDYNVAIVEAESWEQATVEAANWWGVRWGKVAATCTLQKAEELRPIKCKLCPAVFYGQEGEKPVCPKCAARERDRKLNEKANARRYWMEMRPKRPGGDE